MSVPKIIEQKITLENGGWTLKSYLIGQYLGKGGFARCFQATEMDSQEQVAIKIINKDTLLKNRAKQKLLSQIKIHKALLHKYIVGFKTVFEDDNHVFIILQLCTGRSLSEMVKKRGNLTCEQTRYYLHQLLSALQYLHSNKVIHRDLKMANIFLNSNMELKLGDFGLSAKLQFNQERKRTMAGTPNYIAPQIIDGSSGHSFQVDIWSTGVICYALIFGRPPFQTAQLKMTYNRIRNCQFHFPNSVDIPNSAKDFIKKVLVVDPTKRLTISQMFQHQFMKGERPKSIPSFAAYQKPIFTKNQIICQENIHPTNSINYKLPNNILRTSSSINKPQSLRTSSRINTDYEKQSKTDRIKTYSQELTTIKSNSLKQNQSKNLGITVLSYVDYSTKYGLGYHLSCGCLGVYFNDSTVLAVDKNKIKYFYINNPGHTDKYDEYQDSDLPKDHNFNKKKVLLHKFQSHLLDQSNKKQNKNQGNYQNDDHVFVKQWLKTKHAIMFRLSNRIFQVDFFDHSQIILKTDTKQIKFKSKKGQEQFLSLSQALDDKERDTELGRRIKYTKQILNSLKKGNTEKNSNQKAQQR